MPVLSMPRIRTCSFALGICTSFVLLTVLTTSAKPVNNAQPKPAAPGWPMFGGTPQRNMVNLVDKNMPIAWSVKEGERKNIKWAADLRSYHIGQPVIANGKVFVVCRNTEPLNPDIPRNSFVCSAFRETDGAVLWRITHAIPADASTEMQSIPAVDEGRLYYMTPTSEVICADTETGKIAWRFDMKQLSVRPPFTCPAWRCITSPLVVGDLVYLATGNGRDFDREFTATAPSFLALNKRTGKVAWQSNLPGKNLIDASLSHPAFTIVDGVPQVIFGGGDGVIYSFEPDSGKLIWKCDCVPTRKKQDERESDLFFVGAPVIVGNRLFIGLGVRMPRSNYQRCSWFLCLDITKRGDTSLRDYDAKAPANKDSALVWAFGGPIVPAPVKGRRAYFDSTVSTAAVHDGLVYIAEEYGYLHCLDAKSGEHYWQHDFKTALTGSPYWVDSKIYVATEDGDVCIFAHGKTKRLLATVDMDESISTTPTAANGVLYLLTHSKLHAIGKQ